MDTQTAVLISTVEVWISAPDTQTPIFLGFLGIHSWLWFFCRETKSFGYFTEVHVTKIRVSAPPSYKNPTVTFSFLNDLVKARQVSYIFSPDSQGFLRCYNLPLTLQGSNHLDNFRNFDFMLVLKSNTLRMS